MKSTIGSGMSLTGRMSKGACLLVESNALIPA